MATAGSKAFAGKFLEKLDKISHEEIESFLTRLQSEKSFFEAVLSHLVEGVVVTDPDGRILYLNPEARKCLSLGATQKVVGGPLLDCVGRGPLFDLLVEYDPARDRIHAAEIKPAGPDNRSFQVTLAPINNEEGRLVSILTLIRETTLSRREEERRIQAERLSSLATLTAGVAHEIKNPLNSLTIHAHLVQKAVARQDPKGRGAESADAKRFTRSVDIVIEEIGRLSRVVDDFLLAARPSEPQFEMKNVNDVLRRLGELMGPEVETRGVKVDMELARDIPFSLIDELQLTQAFRNVVKNSLEAIGDGQGQIRIESRLTPEAIIVEFDDNGCGIPQDDIQKIFEPYMTTKFSGTGLGLMVVHRIVSEHRGIIEVQSQPDQGTTIRIALPLGTNPRRLLPEKTTAEEADA